MITVGSRYEETRDMDIVPVGKLVRADIKRLHPGLKFRMQVNRFALGCSLDLQAYVPAEMTPEDRQQLKHSLYGIMDSFNRQESDAQSDYMHSRFFSHVLLRNLEG